MPRLDKITVELTLPFVGKIGGSWAPDDAERQAAWEMYVELATRVAVQPLAPEEGLLREALTSYHSLFGTTRTILRDHGPRIAQPHRGGDLSFGYLALAVLNGALRPILARWHPELLAHETQRPAGESPVAWERTWPHAGELRQELDTTHHALLDYADLLAEVADVPRLHVDPHGPANNWP
jgi:hypothetical protein